MTIDLDALEKLAARIWLAVNDRRYPRFSDMESAAETMDTLIAELKEARQVIKPLSDCEIIEPDQPLADDITARYLFSMGEIRAARAFLARNGKGEG